MSWPGSGFSLRPELVSLCERGDLRLTAGKSVFFMLFGFCGGEPEVECEKGPKPFGKGGKGRFAKGKLLVFVTAITISLGKVIISR